MACEDVGIEPVVCRGFAGKQDGGNLGPADTVIGTAGDLQGLQQQGQKQSQSKLAVQYVVLVACLAVCAYKLQGARSLAPSLTHECDQRRSGTTACPAWPNLGVRLSSQSSKAYCKLDEQLEQRLGFQGETHHPNTAYYGHLGNHTALLLQPAPLDRCHSQCRPAHTFELLSPQLLAVAGPNLPALHPL